MPITAAVLTRPKVLSAAVAAAILALALLAAPALGRELYAADYETDNVAVISSETGLPVMPPISTGENSGPYTLAISPDGRTVYTANYNSDTVSAIDTQTKSVVGVPIPVGEEPIGIAITPDGKHAVVCNGGSDDVTVIDLQTGQPVATIPVGNEPQGVAINPAGTRAFVADTGEEAVTVIDLQTNLVTGAPITVGNRPYGIAVTPDGSKVLVANLNDDTVSVIDAATGTVLGSPIPTGEHPVGVAITPDGRRAFVGNWLDDTVTAIDIPSGTAVATIPGLVDAEYIALTPDGKKAFVSEYEEGNVFAFDPVGLTGLGGPFASGGDGTGQIAAVPNQPPVAGFSAASARVRPGVPVTFDASASHDPDGSIASFAWAFGDGGAATLATPQTTHAFAKPGKYTTTLTLTDNEGCSTSFVFTGQTAYCNGSAVATWALTVKVANPGVRVKCPKKAKGACRFALQAVARKGKKKLKPLSSAARVKVKPGKSAIVSLKPKKAFRKKLAKAKKILVREKQTVGGKQQVRVRKLKVVQ